MSPVKPIPAGPDLPTLGWHRTGPDKDKFANYSFIMEPTWYEAQAIKNGDLKVLVTSECNPAQTEMGQEEWRKAVCLPGENGEEYRLEMLVSYEIMHSETSRYADLVLPDKSYFERWELLYMPWWYNFGHGVALRQPLVDAPGECRHSNEVFIELGKRLFPEYFQFKDDVEYYDIQLKGLGLSVAKLQAMGGLWSPGTMGFRKYKETGFGTPSKKVHLYWEDLEEAGQAMPRQGLAPEYEVDVKEYPFVLISYRTIFHQGTGQWSHNNPQLRDPVSGLYENPVLINPIAAKKLGIEDGQTVTLSSRTGELKVRAKLSERIRPDCVGLHHGFGSTVGRVAATGNGVSDNVLVPDSGMTLDWQDLVGGESHVSTRVRLSA
jgi:thiosulfate reductase/polysulfide reductase chain A